MHFRTTLLTALTCALSTSGCFGLDGDTSSGEEGRSEWSIEDGLCPGLAGDCALDVPLAAGASTTLQLEVPGRETLAGIEVVGEGAVVVDDLEIVAPSDGEDEPYAHVDVTALEAGEGTLVLRDADGEIDRAHLTVAEPVGLSCGIYPEGEGVDWAMDDLVPTEVATFAMRPVTPRPQLACRLLDAEGEPMLSVDIVRWEIVESDGAVLLDRGDLFASPGESARGARIYADIRAPGVTTVRAAVGELSWTIDLTVTLE
ncbi:MAG TPA: hypothetical protein RMH99_08890 [Sandaracinaceae bacterium LLY-WYZ-13_1]|nr:hypothetical protein [Sandaracinaceae bacterium LLY-WYZ-13_1]